MLPRGDCSSTAFSCLVCCNSHSGSKPSLAASTSVQGSGTAFFLSTPWWGCAQLSRAGGGAPSRLGQLSPGDGRLSASTTGACLWLERRLSLPFKQIFEFKCCLAQRQNPNTLSRSLPHTHLHKDPGYRNLKKKGNRGNLPGLSHCSTQLISST